MTTKLLVWNLSKFGVNKTDNPSLERKPGAGGNSYAAAAAFRHQVMVQALNAADPDVFVIIELSSGDSSPASLVTPTGGLAGAIVWLNRLRAAQPAALWRLVPPLRIGTGRKAEGVAVFYRGASPAPGGVITRYFTGPNAWNGGINGTSFDPAAGGVANPYPNAAPGPDLSTLLDYPAPPGPPVARVTPANSQHNPNVPEGILAARTVFAMAGAPGWFVNFQGLREPYMVTFNEQAPGGASRDLTLFAVHSPAVTGNQAVFVDALALTSAVTSVPPATETRIVAGDFNLPLFDAAGTYANAYNSLTLGGFVPLLLSTAAVPPVAQQEQYKGYFTTHLRHVASLDRDTRFLWSDVGIPSYYPGYGYMGSNMVDDFESIDNILVWPHVPPPYDYRTTILNHVVGSPLTAAGVPPAGAPAGTLAMAPSMALAGAPWPAVPAAGAWTMGGATHATGWNQYGHIRSTSDHFALYAEIP
ncbi:MAG TPA: hypothetical protein VG318_15235 [Actinomycetota bacterium]|nr:hypothetical protein [Actinomycetota bacterium]